MTSAFALLCLSSFLLPSVTVASASNNATATELPAALRQLVTAYHDRGEFDGVVVIAKRDTVLFQGGFGSANREQKIANAPNTPYPICSITKQFTAVLTMQQIEQGKLDLDGKVTDYLPDYRRDTGSKITIRHLLSHTSGLPNLESGQPEKNGVPLLYTLTDPRQTNLPEVIKTYCSGDLKSVPGTTFDYNNADYLVLQAILERVSGKPYATLLKDRILKPLGMRHTGMITGDTFAKKQALGYVKTDAGFAPEPYYHRANFGAAGAMYSTAEDLLRWSRAIDQDRVLSRKYRDIMFTPYPTNGYGALGSWTFPFAVPGTTLKPQFIDREGAIGAFQLSSLYAPAEGYTVLIFSNTDSANLGPIYMGKGLAFDILKLLYTTRSE